MYQKGNKELRILSLYLGEYTKSFYLREISRLSKIPLKTTQSTLSGLEKKRILKSNVRGKNKDFYLNLDNIETKHYLLQTEIYRTNLFIRKYPVFKTFLKELRTKSAIAVFGSFAKFTAKKDSDLDLLCIPEAKPPLHLLPYKVHKVYLTEKNFLKEKRLMKEVLDNHIILNNHSHFIDIIWGKHEAT